MEILETREVSRNRFLHLFETDYRDRNGATKGWVFASRRNPPKHRTGDFTPPDAVVIAAKHLQRDAIVLIEEFRVPLGGYQFGFPAGLIDPGESIAATTGRELKEETGLSLVRVLEASPPIYSSSGMTDESISMVFCECTGEPSDSANEASEDIRVRLVDRAAAAAVCSNPDYKVDAKAWLVLHAFAVSGVFGLCLPPGDLSADGSRSP